MTWDRQLYFPSEGRRAEDFFALKNPTALARFEPANLGTKGQHATPRPPKPLKYCFTHHLLTTVKRKNHIITLLDVLLGGFYHTRSKTVSRRQWGVLSMTENNILRIANSLIWHYNSCKIWCHLTAEHASNQTKFCNTMKFTFCDFYKTCGQYLHDLIYNFSSQIHITYSQIQNM